jgi:hypothetical protein
MPFIADTGQPLGPFWKRAVVRLSESWPTPLLVPDPLRDLTLAPQWVWFPDLFAHVAPRRNGSAALCRMGAAGLDRHGRARPLRLTR